MGFSLEYPFFVIPIYIINLTEVTINYKKYAPLKMYRSTFYIRSGMWQGGIMQNKIEDISWDLYVGCRISK